MSVAVGDRAELVCRVGPEETIHLGSDAPDGGAVVFSTPAMINLMEHAAREVLRPHLDRGAESVGVRVEVEHLAATPLAAQVRAEAVVTAVDGRQVDFRIRAWDAADEIGAGTHRRALVHVERIRQRLATKREALPHNDGIAMPGFANAEAASAPRELPELKHITVQIEGAVATATLNRPQRNNAVDVQMTGDWERLIAYLAVHPDLRILIVTGAGGNFCAGDDVKEVATLDMDEATRLSHRQARVYLALEQLPQVTIAAVDGFALGAGCVCAYSCDYRIATSAAKFGMPEIRLGWAPGYGVAQLMALVGKAQALDLCLTGKQITARRAAEIGLVHQVVPVPRLQAAVAELTKSLLATPAMALRETKRLLHADEGIRPKITYLADTAAYIRCLDADDAREGLAAFREKRPPKFRGK